MLTRIIRSSAQITPQLMAAVTKRAPAIALLQAQWCHHKPDEIFINGERLYPYNKGLRPLGPKNDVPEFKVFFGFTDKFQY